MNHSFEGDTFFPEIDMNKWEIVEYLHGTLNNENIYKHTFLTLCKKTK
ncbi:dihydrofolate reductase [Clostridium botulinum]